MYLTDYITAFIGLLSTIIILLCKILLYINGFKTHIFSNIFLDFRNMRILCIKKPKYLPLYVSLIVTNVLLLIILLYFFINMIWP